MLPVQRTLLPRSERPSCLAACPCSPSTSAPFAAPQHSHRSRTLHIPKVTPEFIDAATQLASHLPFAYEPVALPCSLMKCGDAVYRSTLDPSLYRTSGFDWRSAILLATAATYLFIPPGVFPGFIDYYVLGPYLRKTSKTYGKNDVIVGRKLATGGFGTVFRGELKEDNGQKTQIVLKKAKEFGEAEVWMNERMMRVGGQHCAEFVTAFDENAKPVPGSPLDNSVWLVWKYEGDFTLGDLMQKPGFPYTVETLLFGRELRLDKGLRRKSAIIKALMRQLLEAVAACHSTGIVHRDIKPQNCILSTRDNKLKLIDLGAAADLRVGINYVPNEYLLDPRYAPPQQYIMSTQTPKPPPAPVAAFLSPILFIMEQPDRFDIYSCGISLLQLAFSPLRDDNRLIAFNKRLAALNWDLPKWRKEEEERLAKLDLKGSKPDKLRADWEEGFALMDLDGGLGWQLVQGLMAYKPADRLTAKQALSHPWLDSNSSSTSSSINAALTPVLNSVSGTVSSTVSKLMTNEALEEAMAKSKTGLTEALLMQELGMSEKAPMPDRDASKTIAWWQERQAELKRRELLKAGKVDEAKAVKAPLLPKVPSGTTPVKGGAGSPGLKLKIPVVLGNSKAKEDSKGKPVANGNGKVAPAVGKAAVKGKAASSRDSDDDDDDDEAAGKRRGFDLRNVFRNK